METFDIKDRNLYTLDGNRENVLLIFDCMNYGALSIEYWDLIITGEHIVGSYKGESFRSFLLRWEVVGDGIPDELTESVIIAAHPKNFSLRKADVREVILKKGSFFKPAFLIINLNGGNSLKFTLSKKEENKHNLMHARDMNMLKTSFPFHAY